MKASLKWNRAATIYPTDHIVSSKARELGVFGFKPEYENVKHVNMRFILSNEYMRLWFKERDLYQKENYSKQEKTKNETNLKRGFVQRMNMNPRQPKELPIIELKRFQNIMSRIDARRSVEEKTKICERYKETVLPIKPQRYKPACTEHKHKTSKIETMKTEKKGGQSSKLKQKSLKKEKEEKPKSGDYPLVCKLVK